MTVIFVAENVESHGFLLPFTHPPSPLPHDECIYCEMVILFRNAPNHTPPTGGWNGHVTGEPGLCSSTLLVNKYPLSPMTE